MGQGQRPAFLSAIESDTEWDSADQQRVPLWGRQPVAHRLGVLRAPRRAGVGIAYCSGGNPGVSPLGSQTALPGAVPLFHLSVPTKP